jgi:hypothetical protein
VIGSQHSKQQLSPARILNLKVIASQQKATLIACLDINHKSDR